MQNKIRELRKKQKYTQEELAQSVGVRRETILSLEKGRYNPSLRLAHALATVLDSSIDELFMFNE